MNDNPAHIRRTYFAIFVALMLLLLATIGLAFVDLGPFNFAIALTIAIIKAALVAFFFMNLRHSSNLTRLFAAVGLLWLLLMFLLTLSDFLTRGWLVG